MPCQGYFPFIINIKKIIFVTFDVEQMHINRIIAAKIKVTFICFGEIFNICSINRVSKQWHILVFNEENTSKTNT